ncbi:MAG: hypothetical protein FWF05_01565 [Oscillospiraceae bacterium]|nr:hypothetical protein [Oscillospiraceae bacterium]
MDTVPNTPHWFPLDTVATIYPYSSTSSYNSTYRIAFVLKKDVDPVILKRAVHDIAPRFPSFFVQLRNGMFWPYFERAGDMDIVVPETEYPCHMTELFETGKPAVRVIYHKRRLGLEVFHGVADGLASFTVLKTLTARYLTLKGDTIPSGGYLNIMEPPKPSEYANDYLKAFKKHAGKAARDVLSYQHKAKTVPDYFRAIHGLVPVEDIKKLCGEYGVSVTEYAAALIIYSLYRDNPQNKKPILISVPVNLRPIFGYPDSLRNFSYFTTVGFTPAPGRPTDFEDIVEAIRGRIKENSLPENMTVQVSRPVAAAVNPAVRFLPNIIKLPLMKAGYHVIGGKRHSCCMSNLGVINLPPEMADKIDRAEALMRGTKNETLGCVMLSFGGVFGVNFTGKSKNAEVPRLFFTYLAEKGARVRVECSDKEAWC